MGKVQPAGTTNQVCAGCGLTQIQDVQIVQIDRSRRAPATKYQQSVPKECCTVTARERPEVRTENWL